MFLLLLSVIAVGQQKDKKPKHPPPGKLVDVGGYRLHLNCTGKRGPTVVLIAGAGDFSFDWSLVQPGVSRFTRGCSYDRAGLAWSEPGRQLLNPLFGRHPQAERSEEEHGSGDEIKYDRTPSWYLPTETKEVGREDVAQADTDP